MKRMSFVFAAALVVSGSSVAWAQDDLGRILERDRIAGQKLQSDANHALTQSRALEKADLSGAIELVHDALTKVRNSTVLPAEDRTRLLERLQARQRELIAAAQARIRAEDEAARRAEQKFLQEARDRDQFGGGRSKPATGQTPADIASKVIDSRKGQVTSIEKSRNDRLTKSEAVLGSVDRTATPINGVVEYPKYWDRIVDRSKAKLSEKEVALLKALNSTLSVDFDKTRMSKVLDFIQDKAGLTILVDEPSLKDANVDLYEDVVTFKVKKVTVRTILRKVLADRGLGYVIKDGMLQVMTQQKCREQMVVRAYPVNDLVAIDNQLFWGPVFSRALMLQNAQRLIDMIATSIEPAHWNVNGGPGSITFHEPTMAIVIRASAEMHYMLGGNGMVSR